MTPEAEIISTRYTKSVIKSCAALSYIEAQARMDDRCYSIPILVVSIPLYFFSNYNDDASFYLRSYSHPHKNFLSPT
jgi:hypothetical protein